MKTTSIFKSEKGKNEIIRFYDNILAQWPENSEQKYIKTRYGFTFVVDCGKKSDPVLILLHGSSSNSAMWTADIPEYINHFRVIAVDIIGECGKSAENRPDWNSFHYSNWMYDIFREMEISSASIIGCSAGGWIALDFAIKHPDKTNKLVLLATAGVIQVKISTLFVLIFVAISGKNGMKKMNKLVYQNFSPDKQTLNFSQLVQEHFIPRTDALPVFSDMELRKISQPLLFLGGENDCFYNSTKTARRLTQNCKNADCRVLKNTGHVIAEKSNEIVQFLIR